MKKSIYLLVVLVFATIAGLAGGAKAQDTCYANSDVNRDGLVWTVSDMVLVARILSCDAPAPESLYQADLNADCRVDTADLRIYENYYIYGPPRPFPVPTCCNPTVGSIYAAAKGDVNADGGLSPADAVLMLTCTFTETGGCSLCQADLNCDFELSPADIVQELNYVFLGTPPAGCP